jgi:hypothetical protein
VPVRLPYLRIPLPRSWTLSDGPPGSGARAHRRPIVNRLLLLAVLIPLTGCEARPERWAERQAAADPPELWRVEALGSATSGERPPSVEICADTYLREGFSRPLAEVQGLPCTPAGDPIQTKDGLLRRCTVGTATLLVRTRSEGDADNFTVELRVTTLGAGPSVTAVQTRRYTRIGSCPPGWKVGEATDQAGRRANRVWPASSP